MLHKKGKKVTTRSYCSHINIGEKMKKIIRFIRHNSYLKYLFILAVVINGAIFFLSRTNFSNLVIHPSVQLNRESGPSSMTMTMKKEINTLLPQSTSTNKKKVILLYTTFFGTKFWSNRNQQAFIREMSEVCPKGISQNCIYTYDHALHLKTADALLFHGADVGRDDVKYMPSDLISLRHANKAYHQNWIFLSHESPLLTDYKSKPYNNVFNWTATYNRLSDAFIPYSRYERINTGKDTTATNMKKNYAASKTTLVAWQVSNCGSQTRLQYAKKLEKYVDLVVFGGCGDRFKNNGAACSKSNFKKCEGRLEKFKFYLAFENTFCTDYVTEKYWNTLNRESVPVVMTDSTEPGGAMIPGSFIDVHQFKSIKELADHLKFLDGNDAEYNKYFAWKDKFRTIDYSIYCEICFQINNQAGDQKKKVKDLSFTDKFSRGKTCDQWPDRRKDLERQIAEG